MTESYLPIPQEELEKSYEYFKEVRKRDDWVWEQLEILRQNHPRVYEHSLRVGFLATELAIYDGLPHEEILEMTKAGLLHDIGKGNLPEKILEGGILPQEEKKKIYRHVRIGYRLIKPFDPLVAKIIVGHHEFQSEPYPRQASRLDENDTIKRMQFLLALSDQTDSLLSHRSYKEAWSPIRTQEELTKSFNDQGLIQLAIKTRSQILP